MAFKFLMGFETGHFALVTLFYVTKSLTSKPTHVLPRCMPGGIVLLEYKLFMNLRIQISVPKHKMVLKEVTITLGLKLDTILNLNWSNDLFPDDPAQKINPKL